jgi:hypothetical protein
MFTAELNSSVFELSFLNGSVELSVSSTVAVLSFAVFLLFLRGRDSTELSEKPKISKKS